MTDKPMNNENKALGKKPPIPKSLEEIGNVVFIANVAQFRKQALIEAADELDDFNASKNIIGRECRYKEIEKIAKKLRISAGDSK